MILKKKRRRPPWRKPLPGDNPDKGVFRLLEQFDKRLEERRRVDFYLYFPSRKKIERAHAELLCLGLTAEIIESEREWLCLASKTILPSINTITGLRMVLEDVARRCGGRYDGWETMILE